MIPLRDDTERDRAPVLALVAALASALAAVFVLVSGAGGWAALLLALDAGAIWVFGAGVEGAVGRGWLVFAVVFGAVGGAALALAAGADDGTGAALELAVTHLLRLRGATILSLVLVPWFGGFATIPAPAWALVWGALAVVLIALGALAA